MKQVYSLTNVALVFIAAFVPRQLSAQCTCNGGVPATTLVYTSTLSPTNVPSATISLPQFNPSTNPGMDLACVALFDTLSAVTTSGARNLNSSTALLPPGNLQYSPTGRMEYSFVLPVTANVLGPGINQSHTFTTTYGPDSLGAYGQPDDTITYGPTNIFTNFTGTKASTSPSSYIGTGNISLSYSILGNLNATEGSLNFAQRVTAIYSGNFGLTYYLCPIVPLAMNITNFLAFKNNKYIMLQWLGANNQTGINYEIQYSKDGNQYLSIGNIPAGANASGTVTQYQYQYNPAPTDVGQLYFRIKRTDSNGNISYSLIKIVDMNGSGPIIGIQTYPNPVVNTIMVQFAENQSGNFMLELVNITGQVIQQKSVTFSGNSLTRFDLNNHPPKGLYFLRAKDLSGDKQYVTKIMIQ